MVYGHGFMGVTEANYAVVLLHLVTSIIGWVALAEAMQLARDSLFCCQRMWAVTCHDDPVCPLPQAAALALAAVCSADEEQLGEVSVAPSHYEYSCRGSSKRWPASGSCSLGSPTL
jgi:hypothetical protein